jgi:hypothetical protein
VSISTEAERLHAAKEEEKKKTVHQFYSIIESASVAAAAAAAVQKCLQKHLRRIFFSSQISILKRYLHLFLEREIK